MFLFFATDERRGRTAEQRNLEINTIKANMLQNAEKTGEEAVYLLSITELLLVQNYYCPHQLECCGVTPAPGYARHCRGRDAMSQGPCTRWILFPGGCSAAGLWELWCWRQDRSRTSAALYHPAASQSQTGCNHKTNIFRSCFIQQKAATSEADQCFRDEGHQS